MFFEKFSSDFRKSRVAFKQNFDLEEGILSAPPSPSHTPHTHKVMYDCEANLIYWMFSNYITGRQLLRVKRILSSHCWNLVQKKNIKTWKFAILDKEKPKRTKKRKLESNEEKYRSVFPSSTLKQFDLLCFNKTKIWKNRKIKWFWYLH